MRSDNSKIQNSKTVRRHSLKNTISPILLDKKILVFIADFACLSFYSPNHPITQSPNHPITNSQIKKAVHYRQPFT